MQIDGPNIVGTGKYTNNTHTLMLMDYFRLVSIVSRTISMVRPMMTMTTNHCSVRCWTYYHRPFCFDHHPSSFSVFVTAFFLCSTPHLWASVRTFKYSCDTRFGIAASRPADPSKRDERTQLDKIVWRRWLFVYNCSSVVFLFRHSMCARDCQCMQKEFWHS